MAKIQLKMVEMNTKYEQLVEQYEQKRMDFLVGKAKLQFDQGSAKVWVVDMKYILNMGEEKVCLILSRQKAKTRQMVPESLDNSWNTWSTQATELELLKVDHENKMKQV